MHCNRYEFATTRHCGNWRHSACEVKGSSKADSFMTENQSCIRLLASILDKLGNLPSGPSWVRDVLEGKYRFPTSLQVGDGQAIYITPEINRMLALFSKAVMDVFFDSQKSEFTDSEWDQMVKRAFGTALVDCREENRLEEDATAILTAVRKTVEDRICDVQPREYAFGCHLSKIPDLEPLSIGTVRFEPRRAWLARMHGSGCASDITRSRIERAWEGGGHGIVKERRGAEHERGGPSGGDTGGIGEAIAAGGGVSVPDKSSNHWLLAVAAAAAQCRYEPSTCPGIDA